MMKGPLPTHVGNLKGRCASLYNYMLSSAEVVESGMDMRPYLLCTILVLLNAQWLVHAIQSKSFKRGNFSYGYL